LPFSFWIGFDHHLVAMDLYQLIKSSGFIVRSPEADENENS
jgi:hypothetical protein